VVYSGSREVVELQVLDLRDNSDEGIAKCFSFASPKSKAQTGPAGRFSQMIRGGYSIMLEVDVLEETLLSTEWCARGQGNFDLGFFCWVKLGIDWAKFGTLN
jgi:hypothetical protein